MQFALKTFKELTTTNLYQILQLRLEVFIVEQNCIYQDIDSKDLMAYHVMGYKKNKLVAYARLFKAGDYFSKTSIGRILVKEQQRRFGYGSNLMQFCIKAIKQNFGTSTIEISAQTYLTNFYSSHGFTKYGEEYLEDGIPHIKMIKV